MKKNKVVLAAIAIFIAMASGAYAAGSATPNIPVSGTVTTICVVGGSGTLAFGNIDAVTNATGATATLAGITLWCTKGDSVTFAVGNGLNFAGSTRNLKSGSDVIPYTVSFTTPVIGQGKTGTPAMVTTLAMSASIAAGALDNVPAAVYGDTVVLTITY